MKKVAIIGAGQIAEKVHAAYYQDKRDRFALAAVVDPDLQRAEAFCRTNHFQKAYDDTETMLAAEAPDLVHVCTPNRFHHHNVLMALASGAAVFCEKPPAMTSAEAAEMQAVAEANQTILAYDFQHRYSDESRFLKENFSKLGEVYFTEANALRRSGVPGWGSFIDKNAQGGGPLIDYGIHMLDTAMYLLDFPEVASVQATSFQKIGTKKSAGTFGSWDPQKFTVEDSLFGTVFFANGGILRINTSFALNIQQEKLLDVQFCGDQAGANLYPAKLYEDQAGQLVMLGELSGEPVIDSQRGVDHFVRKASGDDSAEIADGRQGYIIQRLIEALYRSAETGERVKL